MSFRKDSIKGYTPTMKSWSNLTSLSNCDNEIIIFVFYSTFLLNSAKQFTPEFLNKI